MAELNLLTRDQMTTALASTEGLTHKDVELGSGGAVEFAEVMAG